MFKIIDLYIARTLLSTIAVTLSVLIGLSALIKFVEQLRKLGEGDYDLMLAAVYVLLSLPRDLEQFFPMATLLGGLVGMGVLASNSELVVMQSAGLSRWNIINSAMKSAVVMILFVMAIGEWVTPYSEAKAKQIRTEALTGGSLFSSDELVWAKDGEHFVSIGQVVTREQLRDVSIHDFADDLTLQNIIFATQGHFDGQTWWLEEVTITRFTEEQVSVENQQKRQWNSSLTPDKLGIVAVKPETLSISGLSEYIQYLDNNSQDSGRYQLAWWRKVLQPVSISVMLLTALSFIFGPLRSVTMGARVIMGVLTGFGFFVTNEVFGPLSLVYSLPPFLAALLPSLLFAAVSAFMLRK
ncbi:LPS export ABC transporter permease LptG [Alteromonas lipotrueiana]|uniref:LPS export ABC transporter permease LptG n=1 Tax=Alteromonas lipotrueiana TaxID=2803815 RepID=UPI001C44C402|nr:LPS export ABC transporter permease LptG [Alteromonas lipotrueiana]